MPERLVVAYALILVLAAAFAFLVARLMTREWRGRRRIERQRAAQAARRLATQQD